MKESIKSILVAIILMCQIPGTVFSQNHTYYEPVAENIRGVVLATIGYSSGDISREMFSYGSYNEDSWLGVRMSVLSEKDDISRFTAAINAPELMAGTYNPYNSGLEFIKMPRDSKMMLIPALWHNPYGYAIIYYKNGALPQLVWFSMARVEGENYMKESMKDNLSDLHMFLEGLSEKNKCEWTAVKDSIATWEKEPIDPNGIEKIVVSASKNDSGQPYSRCDLTKLIEYDLCGRKIYRDKENIESIITNLSGLQYVNTLAYCTMDPAVRSYLGADGELIWKNEAAPVVCQIIIYYRNQDTPELIWITEDYVERGFFQYRRSEFFDKLVEYVER